MEEVQPGCFNVTFNLQQYTQLREGLGVNYIPQPDLGFDDGVFINNGTEIRFPGSHGSK